MEEEQKEQNIDNKKTRFSDAKWFQAGPKDIIVGGTGGIGSWVALFLSRIGHNLYLFDNDTIEEVNMAGQFYKINQIGLNKAVATRNNLIDFCGATNVEALGLYTEASETSPIVFSCFDNMAARKLMFDKWKQQEDRICFLDGRMLAESGMTYLVLPGQEALYEQELFDDSEVEEAPCSLKATSHCGAFIASLMVSNFNNLITNQELGFEGRITQFKTDFELPLLTMLEQNVILEENVTA